MESSASRVGDNMGSAFKSIGKNLFGQAEPESRAPSPASPSVNEVEVESRTPRRTRPKPRRQEVPKESPRENPRENPRVVPTETDDDDEEDSFRGVERPGA